MIKKWSCYPHDSGLLMGVTAYTMTLQIDDVKVDKTFLANFVQDEELGWDYLVAKLEYEARSEEVREWLLS